MLLPAVSPKQGDHCAASQLELGEQSVVESLASSAALTGKRREPDRSKREGEDAPESSTKPETSPLFFIPLHCHQLALVSAVWERDAKDFGTFDKQE